jgi:UDP-N-acetylglucosamine diphosphorylase/glucosamine-1-phosphate N-acetyltransferase
LEINSLHLCHFEDRAAAGFEPLSWTRPVFELLCGLDSVRAKQEHFFGLESRGAIVRPHLVKVLKEHYPRLEVGTRIPVVTELMLLVNGRWLPPAGRWPGGESAHIGSIDSEVAYALLPDTANQGTATKTLDEALEVWRHTLPVRPAGGRLFTRLWELVNHNAWQIAEDTNRWRMMARFSDRSAEISLVGPAKDLLIDVSAQLDPLVVADTRGGPVVIDRGACISAFTRLDGPCYVGKDSQLLGAKIRSGTTIGPDCRAGGEIEQSIILGHTNKYHDGFLGHAYLGEWINLGAGTQCSDLRNDYGEVSVVVAGQRVPTGSPKAGCFIGDHVKSGIGTLLNTGTSVGVFSFILPSGQLSPRYMPCFCGWSRDGAVANDRLPLLFKTAEKVMARRNLHFSAVQAEMYQELFQQTAAARHEYLITKGSGPARSSGH